MTAFGLESAMYDLTVGRHARASLAADSDRFLGRYRLEPHEREAVASLDFAALQRAGVNPMLLWGLWTCLGRSNVGEYIESLGGSPTGSPEGV